jgi:hypothetical protein
VRRTFLTIASILTIAGLSCALEQTPAAAQSWAQLQVKSMACQALAQELTDMLPGTKADSSAYAIVLSMRESARQAHHYLIAASDLLRVYDGIGATGDKAVTGPFINSSLDEYSVYLEDYVKKVDHDLANTTNAGIKAIGTRLRFEMLQGQSLLRSAQVK